MKKKTNENAQELDSFARIKKKRIQEHNSNH